MHATLTSKGQVTIPKTARDFLHLSAGDRVRFFIHPDGHLVILPKLPISVLRGIASEYERGPTSIEDMDDAVAVAVAEEFEAPSNS